MPRDTTALLEAPPDLTKPTLEGLSWLLRHKEAWPEGFAPMGWDFRCGSRCGIGLVYHFWDNSDNISSMLGIPDDQVTKIFRMGAYFPVVSSKVTPEMVADRIDEYLAKR